MNAFSITLPNGNLALSSMRTPMWWSSKEAAAKALQSSYGGDGKVVHIKLTRDAYAHNGYTVEVLK